MEARLMGLAKRRSKDGDWFEIKIQVHPDEMPSDLYGVPLGTRIGVAMVQISEDEQEKPVSRKFSDLSRAMQAAMRCKDRAFQEWLSQDTDDLDCAKDPVEFTKRRLYSALGVDSLKQLEGEGNAYTAGLWDRLNAQFETDTHLPEQR